MPKSPEEARAIHLADYRPPDFRVPGVGLVFALDEEATCVRSRLRIERQGASSAPLVLDGDPAMRLVAIALDGEPLGPNRYVREGERLMIADVPDGFILDIETEIAPAANTRLEGLYMSCGMLCTQCEAEGFRAITFFPDRPDVMSRYRVRIEADKAHYPVLLSNGNPAGQGELDGGRHYAVWDDPFPKPSYLFALVAGNLACMEDKFITRSGRDVALRIHAPARELPKCRHAMESLKRAMRWDEETSGREYDLDIFNIVAVPDFNMGAMENKSLNIFNTRYVLADPAIATDADFDAVEGVVAHEYFHNWTGNRITCRDWFQLSLKEGLTVFRDREFSADQTSRAVKRIEDVRSLRTRQFVEDAGPMAHPVRPDSYIEINNFYTATVYDKGAEVVRMIHTLLGPEGFRRGMDLYFERHDGQAVTCDDFLAAMADATGADLTQFALWYAQAGTPELAVRSSFESDSGHLRLDVRQRTPPTPGQPDKVPLHIPLLVGLVGPGGEDMAARLVEGEGERRGSDWLLHVRRETESFCFEGLAARPVPSLLRGFSAPVRLNCDLSFKDALFLLAHDGDAFARWEAGQEVMVRILLDLAEDMAAGRAPALDERLIEAVATLLDDDSTDPALVAMAVTLPSEIYLGERMATVAVEALHGARLFARAELGRRLMDRWERVYEANRTALWRPTAGDKAKRALKSVALDYLVAAGRKALAARQYRDADNMTDRLAALRLLADTDAPERSRALSDFFRRYEDEPLAIDKWFSVQALSERPDVLGDVLALRAHPAFTLRNPNRAWALAGAFSAGNQSGFHHASGRGYRFLADIVAELDPLNPQLGARLLTPLTRHKRFDVARAQKMRGQLKRLLAIKGLSKDVFEIASKSLEQH